MSFVAIVELSIGMIFAWLLVSVSAMFIQEWIVGILAWRSTMLESTINNLVGDPTLTQQVYAHPLIKALHSGNKGSSKPSYIPAAQFSLALLDIIKNAAKEPAQIYNTLLAIKADLNSQKMAKKSAILAKLDEACAAAQKAISMDGPAATALMDEVKGIIRILSAEHPAAKPVIEKHFAAFGEHLRQVEIHRQSKLLTNQAAFSEMELGLYSMQFSSPSIRQALEALVLEAREAGQRADNQIGIVRSNIEAWFNSSMDRLGGWYKRRAQYASFLIGLVLALSFNIDSFQLANQLWRDPSVRQIIAAQADELVRQNSDSGSIDPEQMLNLTLQLNSLNMPVGWLGTPLAMSDEGAVFMAAGLQKRCSLMPVSSVELWGVRIGNSCYPIINTPEEADPAGWLIKLIGLLITAAATAQGAPFWFDILKNLVNIRSAGANTEVKSIKPAN